MKTITLLGLAGIVFLSLAQPTWAGPRGRGSGSSGHFGGSGGHVGGVPTGGSRAAPAFHGGGIRGAPSLGGAYYAGRSVSRPSVTPRFYYGGSRMSAGRPHGFTRSVNRSTRPSAGRVAAANRQPARFGSNATATRRQPNRVSSTADRNRVSQVSTARNREFIRNHSSERHDGNWHRDWDKHRVHFHNNLVFVFVGGSWWGLYPWDYYPYYGYGAYPYDYSGYYPDGYDYSSGYPYDYYNYSPYSDDDQPGYSDSGQSAANATVSAVQSELAKLGYYNGAIDGTLGDQTEAALARYQEDRDLSVTGTVDDATLQSLGIR
jgi:hypothetical protein